MLRVGKASAVSREDHFPAAFQASHAGGREHVDLIDLYQREWSPLLRTAYALVGSLPIAEEIVQDAFVGLQSTRTTVLNPGAYLRRSVINGCHSTHRHASVVSRTLIPAQGPAIVFHL